jgi:hypothetical protein
MKLGYVYFVVGLLFGLAFQLMPYLGWGFQYLPGDLGDTRFNLFVLEHGKQFLFGEVTHYWSAGFMHPEPEVISLSDNLLGTVPIYAFFRLFGLDIFTSFQAWAVTLAVLNFSAAYALIKHLLKSDMAAAIGAFVFAFSLGLAAQMNHAQMYPRFAIPLTILFLLLWFDRKQWKFFALSITCFVYQLYCGIYLGFMLLLPYLLILAVLIWNNRSWLKEMLSTTKHKVLYGLTLLLNGVFILLLFLPYLRRAKTSELFQYSQVAGSLPSPLSYVSSSPGSLIHGYLENTTVHYNAFWDHWIFPGWITLIAFLGVIVLVLIQSLNSLVSIHKYTALVILAGALCFVVFLRVGDYSLYYFIHKLPGFSAMRSLARIINVELLFMGISVGIVFLLLKKKFSRFSIVFFFAFLFLLVIDNYQYSERILRNEKVLFEERHAQMMSKFNHLPTGSIVSYEPVDVEDNIAHVQLDVMLAAQALHLKSVNGYSGAAPHNFYKYWGQPNEENRLFYFERFTEEEIGKVFVVK